MSTYADFVESKSQSGAMCGFNPIWIPSQLFDFQMYACDWAIRKGRGALFFDCGLGKTFMELVWAENVHRHTNKPVLILTPLAVAAQTADEAVKFGIEASIGTGRRIVISNYEKLHQHDPSDFSGVVLDESSILKNFDGARRSQITEFMKKTPYRLLATATAAPNDYTELGTSSEALGELGHIDMLNRFFRNDQNTSDTKMMKRNPISQGGPKSAGWRFKGHAERPFWRWVSSWARACRHPSDLGFDDADFVLPPLNEVEHIIETKTLAPGMLFALPATNLREEREERRRTIQERCEYAAGLATAQSGPSVVWCHLNDEADMLVRLIPGSVQISGSMSDEEKEAAFRGFANGSINKLIIKPKIGAWGLNWQHCHHVITFASHSFEQYYQAVRRCWRFGQTHAVTVDLIATEGEIGAKENLQRKAAAADRMFTCLVEEMNSAMRIEKANDYTRNVEAPAWL